MTYDEVERVQNEARWKLKNDQIDMLECELRTLQARYANAIRLITNFVGLLPPPDVTTPDGRVFQFNAPNPQDTLRRLRDAVDRMREELQVPPAPGYDALQLRRGIEYIMGNFSAFGYVHEYLRGLLTGTCSQP